MLIIKDLKNNECGVNEQNGR